MVEVWFGLLCFTLIVFAVLDGWDIGTGVLHLVVAKNETERREVIAAIGPLWSWHEVWLVAAGGTFILAFPAVLAVSFSGFYLALWLLLWCFLLRGVSIEVGGHIPDKLWQTFWDVVFATANVLLAVLFGAALGNVIRGVPLDRAGKFSMPLFTDFSVQGQVGILDWYTVSVAAFTTVILAAHGATYLRLKTAGTLHDRSERFAKVLWLGTLALFPVITIETWIVRPELYQAMAERPLAWFFVAFIAGGSWALWNGLRRGTDARAFAGSCAVVVGLLAAAAASVFPVMLRSTIAPEYSMTAYQGAAGRSGLTIALIWWPVAFALAVFYVVTILRKYRGKVLLSADNQGFY